MFDVPSHVNEPALNVCVFIVFATGVKLACVKTVVTGEVSNVVESKAILVCPKAIEKLLRVPVVVVVVKPRLVIGPAPIIPAAFNSALVYNN